MRNSWKPCTPLARMRGTARGLFSALGHVWASSTIAGVETSADQDARTATMTLLKTAVVSGLWGIAAPGRCVGRVGWESRTDRQTTEGTIRVGMGAKGCSAGQAGREPDGRRPVDRRGWRGPRCVTYAVLRGAFLAQRPRVWLDTRGSSVSTWVRGEDIVSARVRAADDDVDGQFVLEVFVPGLSTADRWLTVATGTSEWFDDCARRPAAAAAPLRQ